MLIFTNRYLCSTPQLLEGALQGLLHLPVVRLHQEVSLKSSYTGDATRLQCKGSLLPGLPSKKTFCPPEEGVGLASDSPPILRSFLVLLISAVPPWLSKHEEKSSINKYSIVTNNSNNSKNNNSNNSNTSNETDNENLGHEFEIFIAVIPISLMQ